MKKIRLPAKADFAPMEVTYLDSATTHPTSLGAKAAVEAYLEARTYSASGDGYKGRPVEKFVLERFARLINAAPTRFALSRTRATPNIWLSARWTCCGLPGG